MRRALSRILPPAAVLGVLIAAGAALGASPESEEYRDASASRAEDSLIRLRDSLVADSLRRAEAAAAKAKADSLLRGEPDLPNPALVDEVAADEAFLPSLSLLPTAPGPGRAGEGFEREAVSEALRLGAAQTRRYRVLSPEATARPFGRRSAVPEACFTPRCADRAARAASAAGADLVLLSEWSRPSPAAVHPGQERPAVLTLALVEARTGRVRKALRARACPGADGPIPFAQQAVWRLLGEGRDPPFGNLEETSPAGNPRGQGASGDAAAGDGEAAQEPAPDGPAAAEPAPRGTPAQGEPAPGDPEAAPAAPFQGCSLVAEAVLDSGDWRGIAWLNRRDTVDHRLRAAAAASGLLAAGLGLAYLQGQLLGEDGNSASPARPVLGGSGADSWLRGFFASPGLGARYAALGGAGLAEAGDAVAVLLNPAGVADADRESFAFAKRNLADGAPSLHAAYAGPLAGSWRHGFAARYEGDELANETTLHAVLAGDFGAVARGLAGFRLGVGLKAYLAKVGDGGEGLDRSTGHSAGLGLDLGLKARLSERITGALAVRDALSFLKHSNTYTDEGYWEMLPPEYRVGAAYRVDRSLVLALDGQKGLVADQADHVRLGAEKTLFRFLSLRAGLHQAFGRDAVRKLALGFGVDSEGLDDPERPRPLRARVTLDYAYDFGLGEDEPLGTGQQFSLGLSW